MPSVTFIAYDGSIRTIDAAIGTSVMSAAIAEDVPGIDADCGGACACATCHIHVAAEWLERVGPPSSDEAEMLDMAPGVAADSRLSCQVRLTAELDGLTVMTPETQQG